MLCIKCKRTIYNIFCLGKLFSNNILTIGRQSLHIGGNKMKLLIQRVTHASVTVDGKITGQIGQGLLIFIGVCKGDTETQADYLARKAADLRIFEDDAHKMNRSLKDTGGAALVVSQFTLAGNCTKGNRPGFDQAAAADDARHLYEYFSEQLRNQNIRVENGIFQADMQVSLINDGPVTFMLEK